MDRHADLVYFTCNMRRTGKRKSPDPNLQSGPDASLKILFPVILTIAPFRPQVGALAQAGTGAEDLAGLLPWHGLARGGFPAWLDGSVREAAMATLTRIHAAVIELTLPNLTLEPGAWSLAWSLLLASLAKAKANTIKSSEQHPREFPCHVSYPRKPSPKPPSLDSIASSDIHIHIHTYTYTYTPSRSRRMGPSI